jgi:ketosteroid isomerase-like protein
MGETIRTAAGELLRANREFYRAFGSGDFVAMDRMWSEQAAVTCVHPGWDALCGRDRVMASWRGILRRTIPVSARDEVATVVGEVGVIVCVEVLPEGELAATNVYALEQGRWRMLHHHAGLIARSLERDEDPDEGEDPDDDGEDPGAEPGGGERLLN